MKEITENFGIHKCEKIKVRIFAKFLKKKQLFWRYFYMVQGNWCIFDHGSMYQLSIYQLSYGIREFSFLVDRGQVRTSISYFELVPDWQTYNVKISFLNSKIVIQKCLGNLKSFSRTWSLFLN